MTAEFTSEGFSAVASFFGKNDEGNETKNNEDSSSLAPPPPHRTKGNNNRLGVGAGQEINARTKLEADITTKNKIMSIGKKKRNLSPDNEDDENDDVEDSEQEEEEEEEGRTSVVKDKKSVSNKSILSTNAEVDEGKKAKKKKKKKSKKERQREQEALNAKPQEEEVDNESGGSKKDEKDLQVKELVQDKSNDRIPKENEFKTSKKRRKIRSKQKNVRKDNRANNAKPDHLKIGSASYQGRPLTRETRDFLSLPESRSSTIKRRKILLKDSKHDQNEIEGDDLKLGIDSFLDDTDIQSGSSNTANANEGAKNEDIPVDYMHDNGEIVASEASNKEFNTNEKANDMANKKKMKKKKKKSKYKNLKVT